MIGLVEHLLQRNIDAEIVLELFGEAGEVPLLFDRFGGHEAAEEIREIALAQVLHHLGAVARFENFVAKPVDFVTLIVLDVVELKELLADVVVAAFDLALRRFDHARKHLRLDRNTRLEIELVGDGAHTFVIPFARIGRGASDDHLGLALQRLALHGVVVDDARSLVELVTHGVEILTRHVDRRTVRKVASRAPGRAP